MAVAVVIGAAGRMGSWFTSFLKSNGYSVVVCDSDKEAARRLARKNKIKLAEDATAAAKLGQLVLFATPTLTTKRLLRQIDPRISKATLFVEISSVKEPLKRTLEQMRKRGTAVLSIHPMFGHGTRRLAGRTIIVAQQPRRNIVAVKFISTLRRRGARIVETDLSKHDRIAAVTLALPHFMNFAFIDTLKAIRMSPGTARAVGGTTFKLQLLVAEALYHERLENEASILADNKYALELLDSYAKEVNRIRVEMRKGRESLFHNLRSGARYVRRDEMFASAYDRFNAAVEASNLN
jgi:prephenate dehydrogenase